MRVRTVTGMAVAVLVALLWLAITAQPAAAMACARPMPNMTLTLTGGDVPHASGFRSSLTVDGVLAPGALGLPGEQITWIITLRNVGTAPGADIILTDQVHEQLRIDSVEVDHGEFAISGQVVVFNTPFLAPGDQVEMRVNTTVVQAPAGGKVGNHVQLTAPAPGGAFEDAALAEVFVPTGLPATGYPPAARVPDGGEPSVVIVALAGMMAVLFVATYVWWRGSVRRV